MKWLEVIELRSAGSNSDLVLKELTLLTDSMNRENNGPAVTLHVHASVKTDFRIHLLHETDKVANTGSDPGLKIASSLKAFGLVNHNVWIETISKNNKEI